VVPLTHLRRNSPASSRRKHHIKINPANSMTFIVRLTRKINHRHNDGRTTLTFEKTQGFDFLIAHGLIKPPPGEKILRVRGAQVRAIERL
jgi:hypothetical protein